MVKFISFIDEKEHNSLVDLFSQQFYENILVNNPEQDELMILLSILILQEINSMFVPSVKSFLNSSFVGKMLKSLTKRPEIKQFFYQWAAELIIKVEQSLDNFWDIDISRISDYLKKFRPINGDKCFVVEKSRQMFEQNKLNTIVSKTRGTTYYEKYNNKRMSNVNFGVDVQRGTIKQSQVNQVNSINNPNISNNTINNTINSQEKGMTKSESGYPLPKKNTNPFHTILENSGSKQETNDKYIKEVEFSDEEMLSDEDDTDYNNDYLKDLTADELIKRVISEKNEIRKDYLIKQVEKAGTNENLFTNYQLLQIFNGLKLESSDKSKVIALYKKNFENLKKFIDELFAGITSKVDFMPYILRCLCKVIELGVKAKFPDISICEVQSFIGEFIFGKIFLPMLSNPDYNAIITSMVLSLNTRKNLLNISKIIKKMSRFELFESSYEANFTMFNHYLLEMLPITMRFFDSVTDIRLTSIIEKIVNQNTFNLNLNQEFSDKEDWTDDNIQDDSIITNNKEKEKDSKEKSKENKEDNSNKDIVEGTSTNAESKELDKKKVLDNKSKNNEYKELKELYEVDFSFFDIMKEELIEMNAICFDINDVLMIMQVLSRNIKELKTDNYFKTIVKSYEKLTYQETYLKSLVKNDSKLSQQRYLLLFKHDYNPAFNHLLKPKANIFSCSNFNEENTTFILQRVKYCINFVLRQLNMINPKTYSFLRNITQTLEFFSAINEIVLLQDQNSYIDKIPLGWYSIYLNSNISKLEPTYSDSNFIKLYDELLEEITADNALVVEKTNNVISRLGMNIRVADKILEDIVKDRHNVQNIERLIRLEKFIIQAEINICVKFNQSYTGDGSPLVISASKECYHNKLMFLDRVIEGNKVVISTNQPGDKKDKKDGFSVLKFINKSKDKQIDEHGNSIFDFIKLLSRIKEIREEVVEGTEKIKVYDAIYIYIGLVEQVLRQEKLFIHYDKPEIDNCLENIENFIMKKLYKR